MNQVRAMPPKFPKRFLYLLGAILVINILQAAYTELIFDEAYYWHYAKHIAFGYFDHPPMVAWMIRAGSLLFDGELGVRFISCLFSVGTLAVLWCTIDTVHKNRFVPHFFIVAFSMTLLNAYGFFTLPDTPLLFFTALFLWSYKKFIASPSILIAVGMGLVMAGLMYSKYHAVLVILFVILSNVRLLTNKLAWLAVLVALLAYVPHFLWLYEHDFVSILYHLFERPNGAYRFEKYTLGYFVNLIAILGLTFPWVYRAVFKTKAKDPFTKALLYLTYGVLLFFFVSSFNRRVQTQWIIVVSIPLVVLVFKQLIQDPVTRKWMVRMGIANIMILLYLRIGLAIPALFPVHYESHDNERWTGELQNEIGKGPVVFENSYRLAPMYAFYTGNETFSLNNINYRQNQYSIDDSEAKIQDKDVYYISRYMAKEPVVFRNIKDEAFYGKKIPHFESYRKLRVYLEDKKFALSNDGPHLLKVYNPYDKPIALDKLTFGIAYTNDYKRVKKVLPLQTVLQDTKKTALMANDTTYFTFTFPKTTFKDPGYFRIGLSGNGLHVGLNGKTTKLE